MYFLVGEKMAIILQEAIQELEEEIFIKNLKNKKKKHGK